MEEWNCFYVSLADQEEKEEEGDEGRNSHQFVNHISFQQSSSRTLSTEVEVNNYGFLRVINNPRSE